MRALLPAVELSAVKPSNMALSELSDWLRLVEREAGRDHGSAAGCLVVTPLGGRYREEIAGELRVKGVRIDERYKVERFARVSSAIYWAGSYDAAALARAAIFEAAWDGIGEGEAEVWRFDLERYADVADAKRALRTWLPERDVFVGGARFGALHALHLADWAQAASDARRTFAAIECAAAIITHRRAI